MRSALTILICSVALTGCAHGSMSGSPSSQANNAGSPGVLSALRPKADPAMIQRMAEEAQAQRLQQQQLAAQQEKANQNNGDNNLFGSRVLPKVSQELLAPPAEDLTNKNGPVFSNADSPPQSNGGAFPAPPATGGGWSAPQVSMYTPPPPGGFAGGLVPPPPAVSISTNVAMGGGIPADSPYAIQGLNPYGVPAPPQVAAPEGMSARPAGSLFSSGGYSSSRGGNASDDDSAQEKKRANFVPINPTGMEARSAYKQKDDLKALWNGALKQASLQGVARENRLGDQLNHVEIALPPEASRGSASLNQRMADNLFKDGAVDKRAQPAVRKVQGDIAQAYYRYLFTYNTYSRMQQTVRARKQEVEVASSPAEQQRAAADLSNSQTEFDGSNDDMHSAQQELAGVAGAEAARYVIGRVCGAAPSLDSLGGSDAPALASSSGGGSGGFGGMFGFGKKGPPSPKAAPAAKEAKDAKEETSGDDNDAPTKVAKAESKKPEPKEKKGKHGKNKGAGDEKTADLAPAPDGGDAAPAVASKGESSKSESTKGGGAPDSDIGFELKNVNVSARKSVLSVAIRNTGANNFNFNPDVITISEGNHKLSDAAYRAEFDQNSVQPNQEVKGTITIFGRPYNERLAIVLSEGGKNIQLRR